MADEDYNDLDMGFSLSLSLSLSTHMQTYIDALGFIFVLICISMRSVWLLIKDELEKEIKTFKCSMVLYLRKQIT